MRLFMVWIILAITASQAATGQLIPPVEAGEPTVEFKNVNGEIELRDAQSGDPIMLQKGLKHYHTSNHPQAVVPTYEFQVQPRGYDIIYTYTNNASMPRPMAAMSTGIFTIGSEVDELYQKFSLKFVKRNAETANVRTYTYPTYMYSPVAVIRNDRYTVGVSVQYPILEYKHDVTMNMWSPGGKLAQGEGGRGWSFWFTISQIYENSNLYFPGELGPGETRTYVLSIRIEKNQEEWLRTLTPYRNYFLQMYGRVAYTRRNTPVFGCFLADPPSVSESNPYGWKGPPQRRPVLHGYGPFIDYLLDKDVYEEHMIWCFSGAYAHKLNFPYQSASRVFEDPMLTEYLSSGRQLTEISDAGDRIGLWWGHSLQPALTWNPDELEVFDRTNPAHRAAAFKELDAARKLGVNTIGLDAFFPTNIPLWEVRLWLHEMQERYPEFSFVIEPVTCDILHVSAPTYMIATLDHLQPKTFEELINIRNPHYLADFLAPGHETWGACVFGNFKRLGHDYNEQVLTDFVSDMASYGLRPLVIGADAPILKPIIAAESWKDTVPEDLQLPPLTTNPNEPTTIQPSEPTNDHTGTTSLDNQTEEEAPPVNDGPTSSDASPAPDAPKDQDPKPPSSVVTITPQSTTTSPPVTTKGNATPDDEPKTNHKPPSATIVTPGAASNVGISGTVRIMGPLTRQAAQNYAQMLAQIRGQTTAAGSSMSESTMNSPPQPAKNASGPTMKIIIPQSAVRSSASGRGIRVIVPRISADELEEAKKRLNRPIAPPVR